MTDTPPVPASSSADDADAQAGSPQKAQKASKKDHKTRNYIIGGAITVAVLYVTFGVFIPKVADYKSVGAEISNMDPRVFVLLIAAAIMTMVTYWWINMASLPGLRFWPAAEVTQASYAVANTVPAGGPVSLALTYEMLKPFKYGAKDVALMMGVGGIWNIFGKLILPVLAMVVLVFSGEADSQTVTYAIIGVMSLVIALSILGAILWRESLARRLGHGIGSLTGLLLRPLHKSLKIDLAQKFADFRSQVIDVVSKRWIWLTLAAVANQLSYFLALLICLRGAGIPQDQLHWTEVLWVFAYTRLATTVPITPGSVGVAETLYITGLVAAGGPKPEVVAAVLLFRAATYLFPVPVGGVLYLAWRRTVKKLKRAEPLPAEAT